MVVFSFPSIDFFLSPIFKLFCHFLHQKIEICTHDDWLEGVTCINEMPRILISFSPLLSSFDFHSIDSVVHKGTHTHTCPHTHILVHFRPPLPNTNSCPLIPESLTHTPTRQPPAYLGDVPRCWHEREVEHFLNFQIQLKNVICKYRPCNANCFCNYSSNHYCIAWNLPLHDCIYYRLIHYLAVC